jgi:hypothetical protein
MDHGPQIFIPPQDLKNDAKNLNLTNHLMRKCKTLSKEQRRRYIELGKFCEECTTGDKKDGSAEGEKSDSDSDVESVGSDTK